MMAKFPTTPRKSRILLFFLSLFMITSNSSGAECTPPSWYQKQPRKQQDLITVTAESASLPEARARVSLNSWKFLTSNQPNPIKILPRDFITSVGKAPKQSKLDLAQSYIFNALVKRSGAEKSYQKICHKYYVQLKFSDKGPLKAFQHPRLLRELVFFYLNGNLPLLVSEIDWLGNWKNTSPITEELLNQIDENEQNFIKLKKIKSPAATTILELATMHHENLQNMILSYYNTRSNAVLQKFSQRINQHLTYFKLSHEATEQYLTDQEASLRETLSQLSRLDDPEAGYSLGVIIENTKEMRPHERDKKAFNSFLRASDLGSKKANDKLSMYWFKGIGTQKNYAKAVEAILGMDYMSDSRKLYMLGEIYRYGGHNIAQNSQRAINYFYLASQKSNDEAALAIGEMFLTGEQLKRDLKKSISWLNHAKKLGSKAADQLLVKARYELNLDLEKEVERRRQKNDLPEIPAQ